VLYRKVQHKTFRRGLSRKGATGALQSALQQGYNSGIKADISSFFDSIRIDRLDGIIKGLLPFEPLADRCMDWLIELQSMGINGLLQGSPLSPVLSNPYLDYFDRDMEEAQGFRLVRYCDDFAVLIKHSDHIDSTMDRVGLSLKNLGLKLKEEKTVEIKAGKPIQFLGLLITEEYVCEARKDKISVEEEWLPVFKDEWHTGRPVYLSTMSKGAFTSGPSLIVKSYQFGFKHRTRRRR